MVLLTVVIAGMLVLQGVTLVTLYRHSRGVPPDLVGGVRQEMALWEDRIRKRVVPDGGGGTDGAAPARLTHAERQAYWTKQFVAGGPYR